MTDRMLDDLVESCVTEIRSGRQTLADCLDSHDDDREELATLLPALLALSPSAVPLNPQQKINARYRFIEALHEAARPAWWRRWPVALRPGYGALRFAASTASALVVTAGILAGAAMASQDSKPGDALYPVKTAIENAQVAAAGAPENRVRVRVAIANQRLAEVERAIDTQDDESARRAAADYEDAVVRARAELEQTKVTPASVPEVGAALEDNLRRQEVAAARARERGSMSTEATLERARDQIVQLPDRDVLGAGRERPATAPAATLPGVAPDWRATVPGASVGPQGQAASPAGSLDSPERQVGVTMRPDGGEAGAVPMTRPAQPGQGPSDLMPGIDGRSIAAEPSSASQAPQRIAGDQARDPSLPALPSAAGAGAGTDSTGAQGGNAARPGDATPTRDLRDGVDDDPSSGNSGAGANARGAAAAQASGTRQVPAAAAAVAARQITATPTATPVRTATATATATQTAVQSNQRPGGRPDPNGSTSSASSSRPSIVSPPVNMDNGSSRMGGGRPSVGGGGARSRGGRGN